jgi:uncharacterized membrane protein
MRTYVVAYIATAVVFFALDFLWIGTIAFSLYKSRLGDLLLDKPIMPVAGLFYAAYVVGMLIFVVVPALREGGWTQAVLYGALFGFFAYATYDMTNMAVLRGWSPLVTVVDLIWGTALTAVSAGVGTLVTQLVLRK